MPVYTTGNVSPPDEFDCLPQVTRDYLANGAPKGQRDNMLFAAACQFRDAGFDQGRAEAVLIPRAMADGLEETYARRKIVSAYKRAPRDPAAGTGQNDPSSDAAPTQSSPQSTPRSLPSPMADGFRILLETCFEKDERVVLGRGSFNGNGDLAIDAGTMLSREAWLKRISAKPIAEIYATVKDGLFIRINPMKGQGKKDADVVSFRHVLMEFDFDKDGNLIPKELQYAWLVDSGLPIDAILDSGNRSIQGLVRVDAPDLEEFKRRQGLVWKYFESCNCNFDAGNKNPSRYCRCPGINRNLYDAVHILKGTAPQHLLSVKVGAVSFEDWEKSREGPQAFSEEEQQRLRAEALEFYCSKNRHLPLPMADAAYYGIAGQIVDIIAVASEPCRESLLAQFLIGFGSILGRDLYCHQGSDHHLNEFVVLVGETAFGRKGTAWNAIRNLLREVDPAWVKNRTFEGVQSGEAIVHEIRDPRQRMSRGGKMVHDPGVTDKRLGIVEQEFGRVLVVGGREGNTLSTTLRKCWDSEDDLHTGSKNDPEHATYPHVSLIGHITVEELRKRLDQTDNANGFSNRIMWLVVRRAQIVPCPPPIHWKKDHPGILQALCDIKANLTAHRRNFTWQKETLPDWNQYYRSKKGNESGMLGPIIARSAPHVLRLAMLYTALDGSLLIEPKHLKAAIAFVDYCERSAQWIFGERTGDKVADKILWNLERRPAGLTRNEIRREIFSNHCHETTLNMALSLLVTSNLIELSHERANNNKAVERWKMKSSSS
jgi:hypothetical protein